MKRIKEFLDLNLLDSEINRLERLVQEIKRDNNKYRMRLRRLRKVRDSVTLNDEKIVREGEC